MILYHRPIAPVLVAVFATLFGIAAGYSFGYNFSSFGPVFHLGTAFAAICIALIALLVALCPTMLAVGVTMNILAVDFAFHPGTYTVASGGGFVAAAITAAISWEIFHRMYSGSTALVIAGVLAGIADTVWYFTHVSYPIYLNEWTGALLLKVFIPLILVRCIRVRRSR